VFISVIGIDGALTDSWLAC